MDLTPARMGEKGRSKTLDIGFNGVSVSTDLHGTILQIGTFHPKHGIIIAEPYEQFDGTKFRDSSYVREYRARMLKSMRNGIAGFGLRFDGKVQDLEIDQDGLGRATISYRLGQDSAVKVFLRISESGELIQSTEIRSLLKSGSSVNYIMDLGISVNRASYGQLTEGGPIPIPRSENKVSIHGDRGVSIINHPLGAHFNGSLTCDGEVVQIQGVIPDETFLNRPVTATYSGRLEISPDEARKLTARFLLRPGVVPDSLWDAKVPERIGLPGAWKSPEQVGRFIVRRNLEYILGNCAIPIPPSNQAVCLLTDHVALPLGWMRDNYWQVRFLIDAYCTLGGLTDPTIAKEYATLIKSTVKGHLTWVFRYARRPHKFWHRSYLTTGRPKDGPVFQLDQQCYPLLELCDFWESFPEEKILVEQILGSDALAQVLDLIESKKDPQTGLYPTDETPGDDEVEYPFHFSSHILLWHALSKMANLAAQLMHGSALVSRLAALAVEVRKSTLEHFLFSNSSDGTRLFSYLVDGSGRRTFYHDANDLPTLFAVQWGFIKTEVEKEAWKGTMNFGFTASNEGGYYVGGPYEGLGSVHTRNPWTLGYFQQWKYAQMTGDSPTEAAAWQKICGTMLWDGMFSEAVDGHTGEVTSKAWFSWPGSMIGSGLLKQGVRDRYL